jgi:hypothetical protein
METETFIYQDYLIELPYCKYADFYHSKVFKGGKKYDSCQSENKEDCLRQAKSIVKFSIKCDAI